MQLDGLPFTGNGGFPHCSSSVAVFALPVLYGTGLPARLASTMQKPELVFNCLCSSKQGKSSSRPPTSQGSSNHIDIQEGDDSGRIDASGCQTIQD